MWKNILFWLIATIMVGGTIMGALGFSINSWTTGGGIENFTFTGGENQTLSFTIPSDANVTGSHLALTGYSSNTFTSCYQESTNTSNQTGIDGGINCSILNYTGVYDAKNSETYTLYINYTKPSDAISSSLWQVKFGDITAIPTNYSIPSSCWVFSSEKLVFRFYGYNNNGGTHSEIYCQNGDGWQSISSTPTGGREPQSPGTAVTFPTNAVDGDWDSKSYYYGDTLTWKNGGSSVATQYGDIYEDAMWWKISLSVSLPQNISIFSNSILDYQNLSSFNSTVSLSLNNSIINTWLQSLTSIGSQTYSLNFSSATSGILGADISNTINYTDIVPPRFSLNQTNVSSQISGETIHHFLSWQDGTGISSIFFAWNGTGTWQNISNVFLQSYSSCYQETANVSTSCGGASSGNYSFGDVSWDNPTNLIDGSYDTGAKPSSSGTTSTLYVNYTKPTNSFLGTFWYVSSQVVNINSIIPSDCFTQNPIQLSLSSARPSSGMTTLSGNCYNGSSWNTLFSQQPFDFGDFSSIYDEAIYWNVSFSNLTSYNYSVSASPNASLNPFIVGWKQQANDSSNNINISDIFTYQIQNFPPNITSIAISPSPANATSNLSCAVTNTSDTTLNEFYWYINGNQNTSLANLSIITTGNYSDADKIICSARAYDNIDYSNWINSSSLIIADSSPPILISASAASVTVNTLSSIYLTLNDILSTILSATAQITDPNAIITNFTMSFDSGNNTASLNSTWLKSYTPSTTGTYYIKFFYSDTSGNSNFSIDNYISFSATAVPPSSGVGGGGGGQSIISEQLIIFCGNGLCDKGEDIISCRQDCGSVEAAFATLKDSAILILIIIGVLGTVFLYIKKDKKKVKSWQG